MQKLTKLIRLLPPLFLRELKEKYAGSVLGIFWTFLQPVFLILLYWLVFSQIMKIRILLDTGEIPFLAFLLSGLLPWLAIQEGVMNGASSIVNKRNIIKKVIFPAELFPLSSVMSSFVHHGIGILLFLLFFFLWKGSISFLQIWLILILFLIQLMLATGLALLLSSLSVYLRDINQILGLALQAIFYMSPILYPLTAVPEKLKMVILLNPVTSLAESYHSVILYGKYPETGIFIYLILVSVVSLAAGIYSFRKLKRGFADVL